MCFVLAKGLADRGLRGELDQVEGKNPIIFYRNVLARELSLDDSVHTQSQTTPIHASEMETPIQMEMAHA